MQAIKEVVTDYRTLYPGVLEAMDAVDKEEEKYTQYEVDEYVRITELQALLDR